MYRSIIPRLFTIPFLACLALTGSAYADVPKIGVLLKGKTKFWSAVEQGALSAGEKLGAEVIVKMPPTENDVSIQIQLLNGLAKQGVTAIVLAPVNKETLAKPAAALAAQGIKIVVIDSPLDGDAASAFISTDHRAAGAAAGELLKTLVTEADHVSLFRHDQNNSATNNREQGAVEVLRAAYPQITVFSDVFTGNEKEVQLERAKLLLTKHPETKAVLASSTNGTIAMIETLSKQENIGTVKLVGFGFNLNEEVIAALNAGTLYGWIAQRPKEIGAKGVETAVDLLNGKTVPARQSVDVAIVTKANLGEPAIQALLKL